MENFDRADIPPAKRVIVSRAIRARRKELKLSLHDLAERIGVAVSTVSKLETGKIGLSFERMEKIGQALDMDYVELLAISRDGGLTDLASPAGARRSITLAGNESIVDAEAYLEMFHAADMLHKLCQPVVVEILIDEIADYGPFTQHIGEEFNYVLEGEVEFHSDTYAPVRLTAGSSIYFDAEMKHAHVRVGNAPCRMLAIICPRNARGGEAKDGAAPTPKILSSRRSTDKRG